MMYWDVPATCRLGDDLLPWDTLVEILDADAPWKWPDAEVGYDGDVVCLHDSYADSLEMRDGLVAQGYPATVYVIDDADDELSIVTVAEGSVCLRWYSPSARRLPVSL